MLDAVKNLLFIPCYNCAPQIGRVVRSVLEVESCFNEIIFIDNQSSDETVKNIKLALLNNDFKSNVKILSNPQNIGLGGTHKLAFQYAIENHFDHVAILHGDDQGNILDFKDVFKIGIESSSTFYMGARFHKQSTLVNYSRFRTIGNVVFNQVISILAKKKIYDFGGSGLNLFPVKLLIEHPFNNYSNDLTFHTYLLLNAIRLKQQIIFVPISWREDGQISNVKLFSQVKKLILVIKNYYFSRNLISDKGIIFNYSPQDWTSRKIG